MHTLFKSHIREVPAIPAGATREDKLLASGQQLYKLSSNENLLGPSPKAMQAIQANQHLLNEYNFLNDEQLRQALADSFGRQIEPDQFVTGNGAAELLDIICRAFLSAGDECVISSPTFTACKSFALMAGARVVDVPLKGNHFETDVEGILASVNKNTRIIFITNPNNPTGTIIPRHTLRALLAQLPAHVVVVHDEVYHDYVTHPDFAKAQEWIARGANVIGLHSFSKIYGMAGLRLGYAFSTPEIAAYLLRFRRPFMINTLSMKAAIAALGDSEHLQRSRDLVTQEKPWLYTNFDRLGLVYWRSESNFIMFRSPMSTPEFIEEMLTEGVMVRGGQSFGITACSRVTVGRHEDNVKFVEALEKVVSAT